MVARELMRARYAFLRDATWQHWAKVADDSISVQPLGRFIGFRRVCSISLAAHTRQRVPPLGTSVKPARGRAYGRDAGESGIGSRGRCAGGILVEDDGLEFYAQSPTCCAIVGDPFTMGFDPLAA